jgi:hypothetical protein
MHGVVWKYQFLFLGCVVCKPFFPGHFLISNAYLSRSIFVGLSSIGRCVSHHFSLRPFSLEDFNGYPTKNIKYVVVEIH